jgi:transcriptional regulator with XRE-family HTH domain
MVLCVLWILLMDKKLLGERIRLARDRKGLSQEHLANLVEKDQRGISEIEAGNRKLSVTDLPKFAKALDVPILYFFEGEISKDDLDIAMLRVFAQIEHEEVKRSAIDIVHILASTRFSN